MMTPTTLPPRPPRRAFSLVEMLVALTIAATLMAATLVAFDASWRGYKHTTESASTHVVSRIVVQRILSLVRTGTDFATLPDAAADTTEDGTEFTSDRIEFVADADRRAGNDRRTRIERRPSLITQNGFELWYVVVDGSVAAATVLEERPLMRELVDAQFILEYDPGPILRRVTVDFTIQPNDDRDMRTADTMFDSPTIRLVASAVARQGLN